MSLDWDNPVFHEGRVWGRAEERERIIYELKKNVQNDAGDGLTVLDDDGMRVVLNMRGLIGLIGGELVES